METFETWLRRTAGGFDASQPVLPLDNVYAGQLRGAVEAAAAAWHAYGGAAASHSPSATHRMLWYGATEYAVQASAPEGDRETIYKLVSDTLEAERVLRLRSSLNGVLMALGPRPGTNDQDWWLKFRQLANDRRIEETDTHYIIDQLVEELADADWTAERLHERMLTYREHVLPLWQELLTYGGINPSKPVRQLPCI